MWVNRRSLESDRVRVPPPLLRRRIASGRGATEQPNATGDGAAALSGRFWAALVVTGVATGLGGIAMMLILFNVEHLAFGYHSGSLQAAVTRDSPLRRVVSLVVAGVVGGVAWYVLRKHTPGESSEVDEAIWGRTKLSVRRSLGTSAISELVIGMGASIGRESAPKLLGGLSGSVVGDRFGLDAGQVRLLVACGAGAGLAAVYNVPIGGALFACELLLGSVTLPTVMPALACAGIATFVGWLYLPTHATYLGIPAYPFHLTVLVWAVLAGPVVGAVAAAWVRLVAWASFHRLKGRAALVGPLGAFGLLGVIGIAFPQLFGNGKDMAHSAFLGHFGLGLLAALFVLKPLVTALCLGSSASGGLFTPTFSTGAVLGGFLGIAWSHLWAGAPAGAYAVVGAAAMLAAATQAPMSGLVLVLELTHTGFSLAIPMIVAAVLATIVVRIVDGYSIYSARLAKHD